MYAKCFILTRRFRSADWRRLLVATSLAIGLGIVPPTLAASPDVGMSLGPSSIAVPAERFTCASPGKFDAADSPLRAFRDAGGKVHAYLVNHWNYSFEGSSIDNLARPASDGCRTLVQTGESTDPSTFANLQWITNPYTLDGNAVYAVVHNEFHGSQMPQFRSSCAQGPQAGARSCWYGAITLYQSQDAGKTFTPVDPFVIAAPLNPFIPNSRREGPFAQTNIVQNPNDKMYYMLMSMSRGVYRAPGQKAQRQKLGVCIMRSPDLRAWRFWDGQKFDVEIGNPYKVKDPSAVRVCEPVIGRGVVLRSVVYYPRAKRFVAFGLSNHQASYATSPDLIAWSDMAPMPLNADTPRDTYFAVLDPSSPSRNFDTVGDMPNIYWVTRVADRTSRIMRGKNQVLKIPLTLKPAK